MKYIAQARECQESHLQQAAAWMITRGSYFDARSPVLTVFSDVSYPQYQVRQRGAVDGASPCLICLITASISVRSQTSANLPSSTR